MDQSIPEGQARRGEAAIFALHENHMRRPHVHASRDQDQPWLRATDTGISVEDQRFDAHTSKSESPAVSHGAFESFWRYD